MPCCSLTPAFMPGLKGTPQKWALALHLFVLIMKKISFYLDILFLCFSFD
jgi:hypothetical protein